MKIRNIVHFLHRLKLSINYDLFENIEKRNNLSMPKEYCFSASAYPLRGVLGHEFPAEPLALLPRHGLQPLLGRRLAGLAMTMTGMTFISSSLLPESTVTFSLNQLGPKGRIKNAVPSSLNSFQDKIICTYPPNCHYFFPITRNQMLR